MRKRRLSESNASEWLKEFFPHIVLIKWGGLGKNISLFLDRRDDREFNYIFNSLKKSLLKHKNATFGASIQQREAKRKQTILSKTGYDCTFNIPAVRERVNLKLTEKTRDNKNLNKEFFYQQYIVEQKSIQTIAKMLGLGYGTINTYFHKFEIPIRPKSVTAKIVSERPGYKENLRNKNLGRILAEESRQKISKTRIERGVAKGKNNNNWKPPEERKCYLNSAIRESSISKQWKKDVMKRDEYKCVQCGAERCLEIDHIKPMSYIMKKNDIKTLEEAFVCAELWELNNGRVLCETCHKKTDTYSYRARNYSEQL